MGVSISKQEIDEIFDSMPKTPTISKADIDAVFDAPKTPKQTTFKPTRITPTADMYDDRLYIPKHRDLTLEEKMTMDRDFRDQVWEEERKNRIPKLEEETGGNARRPQTDTEVYDYVPTREQFDEFANAVNQYTQRQVIQDQNRSRNAERRREQAKDTGAAPILGSRLSANGQEEITEAGKAEIDELLKEKEKWQKKIDAEDSFTTGDVAVDEVSRSQNKTRYQSKIDKINEKIEKIKQDKHASTEDWLVPRNEYEAYMRDPEFAEDIDKLFKSDIGNGMGGAVNPNAIKIDGKTKKEYVKFLADKYGISEKEIKDIQKTYTADKNSETVSNYNEDVQEYGEEHPLAGTGLSMLASIPNAIEGAYNVGSGLITNDTRNTSRLFDTTKTGLREGVKEDIKPEGGKVAYDIATGLGDLGVGVLTGNAPLMLAGNTANSAYLTAEDRGQSARKAGLYGGASGVVDYITNAIGLDKAKALGMQTFAGDGAKAVLGRLGVAAGTEAGENVIQNISQTFLDQMINGSRSDLQTAYADYLDSGMTADQAYKATFNDWLGSLGSDALMGAAMGAGMYGIGAGKSLVEGGLLKRLADRNSEKTWNNVEEYEKAQALDAEEMARQNEIDAEEVAERQNQAAEEIQTLTEQLPEISLDPEDIERLNAVTDEGPRNEVARETEEAPAVETRPAESPELDDAEPGNPPMGSNGPKPSGLNDLIPSSGEYDESRVITNTGIKSGVISPEDLELNAAMKDMSQHEVHKDKLTLAKAQSDVADYGDQLIREYTNGTRDIKTDLEVDRSMTILSDYDENLANWQRDSMMRNMSEHGTEGGQFIHAFRKWANTAVGALVKATKVDVDNTKAWKSRNQKDFELNNRVAKAIAIMGKPDTPKSNGVPLSHEELKSRIIKTLKDAFGEDAKKFNADDIEYLTVLAETRKVSIRQIADEIEHKLKTGEWFTIDESLPKKEIKNSQILEIVNRLAKGDLPKPEKARTPVEYSKFLTKIKNSLQDPSHGLAEVFNDADAYYVGKMLEAGVPKSTIEEEIRYRLNYGEWRTLDESLPAKKEKLLKNGLIYNMLDEIINGEQPKAEKKSEPYGDFLKKIRNSLNDDSLGVADRFNDADVYFLGQMIQEGVPRKTIEEELRHKLQMGEWFTIDESIEPPKPRNQKLENAFKELMGDTSRVEPTPKTFNEIKDEVKNTLEKEGVLDKFNDSDIEYLANLIQNGASQRDIAEALHTKSATGRWGISDETRQKVNRLYEYARNFNENSREYVEAQAEALRLLAEEVAPKATGIEKFDTWRYMAMLGNPKTMLRNFVGNKLVGAITGASNNLSAAMEHGVDWVYNKKTGEHIQRTKEFLNPVKDKDLLEATKKDAYNSRYRQVQGGKYEKIDQESLKRNRSVWNSDVMRLAEKAIDEGISDTKAVVNKYSTSLAGYMKANGLDVSDIEKSYKYDGLKRKSRDRVLDDAEFKEMLSLRDTAEKMETARDYALKQAEYATFHEDNEVAKLLTETSNKWRHSDNWVAKAGGYALEGIVPFKKTPANILRSGFEYSPFGALKSIKETGKLIYENTGKRKGNLADEYTTKKGKAVQKSLAADVIDSWSKTITGSALTALGYYLFSKGILTSSEKGEKYQDQLEGKGNYAININGHTYTLDWAAPGVMPLLVGAEIKKVMESNGIPNEEWYKNPSKWIQTFNAVLDPMLETSMMSGVKDAFSEAANAAKFSEDDIPGGIIGAILGNTITGYATQAIPTLLGQIARTVDPIRRTTDTKSEDPFLAAAEKQGRKVLNKIPFLSKLNPEYRDAYGRRQLNGPADYTKGDPLGNIRAFENNLTYQMLSPGYLSEVNTTDADRMGREIYNSRDEQGNPILDEEGKPIKDTKIFATWNNTKKVNGVKLDPKQMQTFREEKGTANYELRNALANADWFNELPATKQASIFKSLNTIADKIGQYAVLPGSVDLDDTTSLYLDAGGGAAGAQAIANKLAGKNLAADTGLSGSSTMAKEIKNTAATGDIEAANQLAIDAQTLIDKGASSRAQGLYAGRGKENLPQLSAAEYADAYAIADKDGTGNISQSELLEALPELGVKTNEEALAYWKGLLDKYTEGETKVPVLQADGTFKAEKPSEQTTEQEQTAQEAENIPSVSGSYDYDDINSVFQKMAESGIDTSGARGYWGQASAYLTPSEFYEIYDAIDSALGKANGGISKDEWVKYLNDNGLDYDRDLEIINMLYNTRWPKLKYDNGKWSK